MMHHLFESDLSPEGKLLKRYFDERMLQLEHRIAFQNKAAAKQYLQSHDMEVMRAKGL